LVVAAEANAQPTAAGGAASAAAPVAALDEVAFAYAGSDHRALDGVTLELRRGETIGVMGASGAGKSTLAKCLNRIVPAFEDGDFRGRVAIGGRPIDGSRVCELAQRVGMVFQDFEAQLFSTNVAHEAAFAMEQAGMARAEIAARIGPALEAVGLKGFDDRDPTSLSGGEKQRLAIASVLAMRPDLIVLDEPTTDLDPEGRAEVFALIRRLREEGRTLLVIEHEAEELRACDRIVILRDGAVVAEGEPASVMGRLELLEASGVHPPDLNRLLGMLEIREHAESIDRAEAIIRAHFPDLPRVERSEAEAAEIIAEVRASVRPETAAVAPAAIAQLERVSFAYPFGPRVLDTVDLTIAPGEFIAVIGQNGSGKTTLAKHLVGLLQPGTGRVLIAGRDRAGMAPAATAREVGYVFQNPDHQIFAGTVEEEIAFGPRNLGFDSKEVGRRVEEVLAAVNLGAMRGCDPFLLSKGERQRLAVASVLALRPRLLILDEPTTGLDYSEQRKMMALVRELNREGIAIVIITHTPWLVAEFARRAVLMRRGRVMFDGAVRELFARDDLLAGSSFRAPEATALGRRFGFVALSPEELAGRIRGFA
jgi:energy-coupling factor transporter ATP-binding protein EcfA2